MTNSIKRVPTTFLISNIKNITKNYLEVLYQAQKKYGDTFYIRKKLFLFDPSDINNILLKQSGSLKKSSNYKFMTSLIGGGILSADGARWAKQRKIFNPYFFPEIKRDFQAIYEKKIFDHFMLVSKNSEVNLSKEIRSMVLMITSQELFGSDISKHEEILEDIASDSNKGIIKQLIFPKRSKKVNPQLKAFYNIIHSEIIEPNSESDGIVLDLIKLNKKENEKFIITQLNTLLFAAFDTTSLSLHWFFYCLYKNPRYFLKFSNLVQKNDESIINKEEFKSYIQETIRLYPSVPIFSRELSRDITVNGKKFDIGTHVHFCPYVTHRHQDFWEEAEKYHPERFQGNPKENHAYFPFGLGPRRCLGEELSIKIIEIISYTLTKYFDWNWPKEHVSYPRPMATLRSNAPLIINNFRYKKKN